MCRELILKCFLKLKMFKKECMRKRGRQHGWIHGGTLKGVPGLLVTHAADPRKNTEVEIDLKVNEQKWPIKGLV